MLDERGMFCSSFGVIIRFDSKKTQGWQNAKALGAKFTNVWIPTQVHTLCEMANKQLPISTKQVKLKKEFDLTFC
jgi:hypothetical protein